MSDFFGTPGPSRTSTESGTQRGPERTERTAPVSRQTEDQPDLEARGGATRQQDGSRGDSTADASRDPAVSIAAATAHLARGDRIEGRVDRIDAEGRPIVPTSRHDYALKPDAGLARGDRVVLEITAADRSIDARLLARNGERLATPVPLQLTIIAVHRAALEDGSDGPSATPQQPASYRPAANAAPRLDPTAGDLARATSNDINQLDAALTALLTQGFSTGGAGAAAPAATPTTGGDVTAPPASPAAQTAEPQALLAINQLAFRPDGSAVTLTVATPSLLTLAPDQTARVTAVTPLDVAATRSLALPASVLANASGGPTALETSTGRFIVPADVSPRLVGQVILTLPEGATATSGSSTGISTTGPAQAATSTAASQAISSSQFGTGERAFDGRLLGADGEQTPLVLRFPTLQPASTGAAGDTPGSIGAQPSVPLGSIPIDRVQITATRPASGGPIASHVVHTAIGALSVDLPSPIRPRAGDFVQILQIDDAIPPDATAEAGGAGGAPSGQAGAGVAGLDALQQATGYLAGLASGRIVDNNSEPAPAVLQASAEQGLAEIAARSADGGGRLTNSLLFFLAAMGARKTDAAVGQVAARLLARAPADGNQRTTLLDRLISDTGRLFQAASADRPAGEWRAFTIAFDSRDGHVQPLHLVVRETPPDGDDDHSGAPDGGGGKAQKSFVLQLSFSVLGDVQLHGRIAERRFDLRLASQTALATTLQEELSALFDKALSANDYRGSLSFHGQSAFEDIAALTASAEAAGAPVLL